MKTREKLLVHCGPGMRGGLARKKGASLPFPHNRMRKEGYALFLSIFESRLVVILT